ncbi:MAG: S8 family serine peptidase [Clostridia bacterium]|nr:S8 family serine peptidase [Clostridia bacterium]
MRNSNKNVLKVLAVVLCVLLAYPAFLMSASALDTTKIPAPQIVTTTLQSIMESRSEEKIRVAIWLKDYDTEEALATKSLPDFQTRLETIQEVERTSTAPNETTRSIEVKRAALRLCYEPYTAHFESNFLTDDEIVYASVYLPTIIAELTPARIKAISNLAVVEFIDYYDEGTMETELTPALSTTNGDNSRSFGYTIEDNIQYINAGALRSSMPTNTTVKVGMIDGGNPEARSAYASLNATGKIICHYSNAGESNHASDVLEILASLAPHATFYCGILAVVCQQEFDWFLENGVTVVNISATISSPTTGVYDPDNTYGAVAYYLDQIICTYNLTVVKSAGNEGADGITSGGMAYNIISVGNFDAGNNCMHEQSSYYSGSSQLPSKPDISAPGCSKFNGSAEIEPGTSFAAPIITAIIAIMMSRDTAYLNNPALNKATIVCSTMDEHSYETGDDEYQTFGAGVIDGEKVRQAIVHRQTRTIEGTIGQSLGAYNCHSLNCSEMDPVRVAFVYIRPVTFTQDFPTPTLGIDVYNDYGGLIHGLLYAYQNVKILEFEPFDETSFEIHITRYADNINTTRPSIATESDYAIVWYQ